MLLLESPLNLSQTDSKILLSDVTWEQYETLLNMFGDHAYLHLNYLEGILEIMTPSLNHEMIKKMMARLLEIYALEKEIDLFSCGSANFKNQTISRGLEPDESYCIGKRKELPDLCIEIVITSGGINKLEIYKGLQIKEVWFWEVEKKDLTVYQLQNDQYQQTEKSSFFPNLNLEEFGNYINLLEEPKMIRQFFQKICNS